MSHLGDNVQAHFHSGEQGTTGREPFEDETATAGGQAYSANNTSGDGKGVMSSSTLPGQSNQGQGFGIEQGQNRGTGGLGAAGQGGAIDYSGEEHHGHPEHIHRDEPHHHHHHHSGAQVGQTGQSGASRIDEDTRGTGQTGIHRGQHEGAEYGVGGGNNDRVGDLNQGGAAYERTGAGGPVTGGAAGTDRFDSDRERGTGIGGTGAKPVGGYGGPQDVQDSTTRAEGKGVGGIGGVLGTSDKDFTGRDRLGEGAYHDDNARFQGNTSGPGGSALTGREGDLSKNPVAQSEGQHAAGRTGIATKPHEEEAQGKEGLISKIKHAAGM